MDHLPGFRAFTPRERATFDTFLHLGDAARRGLHVAEQITARQMTLAQARARALAEVIRSRGTAGPL